MKSIEWTSSDWSDFKNYRVLADVNHVSDLFQYAESDELLILGIPFKALVPLDQLFKVQLFFKLFTRQGVEFKKLSATILGRCYPKIIYAYF